MEVYFVILTVAVFKVSGQYSSCIGPDNRLGSCLSYRYCDYIQQLINAYTQNPIFVENYLRRSICGYQGSDILFCCPGQVTQVTTAPPGGFIFFGGPTFSGGSGSSGNVIPPPALPPPSVIGQQFKISTNDESQCGMANATHPKVVGGINSQLHAWPWMAILGYRNALDAATRFQCGGSLVTQQHVLTAAHCIKDALTIVRLGEYDIYSDADGAFPIDVGIQWKKTHESYNSQLISNDIGLIKLTSWVQITDSIRPICLPKFEPLRSKDLTYHQPFVIGWGATAFKGPLASILQEAQVPIVPLEQCSASYQALYPGQVFDDRVLCAGISAGGKDSCQGDSGGPLMYPTITTNGNSFYWNLIGIVSYGFECARPNFPGVYTKVVYFIPWIESHLND